MLNVVTCLWDANEHSMWFSKCYDESWVLRLFAGFRRNLSTPFRPVLFTEKPRRIDESITQIMLSTDRPVYGNFTEPFKLDEPMILCGLDTVVVGNCDGIAEYCMTADRLAVPLDPYDNKKSCNGVSLVPRGQRFMFDNWRGENDMKWINQNPHNVIDELFPGKVKSYKGHVRKNGLGDCRIVYFHGDDKPHQLLDKEPWIKQHWLG